MNVPPSQLILAGLVSPGLLYLGLGAVSLPILIHLLTRRRFRRVRWAAMEFLLDAERRNRRRLRMEEWILLALRCLAVALIGLMLARPFLAPRGVIAGLSGSRRTERVFILDDSFSMGYQSPADGRTPFARAKLAIRRLVESIRRESPEDTVTILRTSAVREPVELQTFLDAPQTEDLFQRLEGLAPTQRSMDTADVMEGAADVLRRSPDVAGAVVYSLSDFQRHNWLELDPKPSEGQANAAKANSGPRGSSGLFTPLTAWADEDRGLRLVLVNVGDAGAANTAMTGLETVTPQIVAGSSGRLRASVANYTSHLLEGASLQVTMGNLPQATQTIRSLGPQQSATLELEVEFPRAGYETVRAEMAADLLPIDNVRYLAVDVANAIRVLIVNGEPASDAYDNEVTFLAAALRPEGELFSGNELVVVDESELDSVSFAGFHLVVLANVYRLSDPAIEALDRFARDGGGIVVFLGDQVDADLYNGALYRDGAGWLPAKLTEIVRAAQPVHLIVSDRLHPALRGVSRADDPLGLGQVPFFQYFAVAPFVPSVPGEDIAAASKKSDTQPDGVTPRAEPRSGGTRVVVRFNNADEHPAVLERPVGEGRVILFTSSADKEWNLWPDHPTYLPVIMELMRYAARRGSMSPDQWVGSKIALSLDPANYESDAAVRSPAYPAEPESTVAAGPAEDGRGFVLNWGHTDMAGIYQFVLRRREGGETVRPVAVNVDPTESDLAAAREEELRRTFPNLLFEYVDGIDKLTGGTGEARTELWRMCWGAAVLILLSEQGLAWFWGRKR